MSTIQGVTEWSVPIDIEHRISMTLIREVRTKLIELHDPTWEPAPIPPDWRPSAYDRLHPAPYSAPYLSLTREKLPVHHRGDEVFFYDYALGGGKHPCILERNDRTGVLRR
jgi:hypothetical protein